MEAKVPFFIFSLTLSCASFARSTQLGWIDMDSSSAETVVNVMSFGAVGNGKTDDSDAFLKAWTKVCIMPKQSTLLVPAGRSFLLKPVLFEGPCKSPRVNVQILGTLLAPKDISLWKDSKSGIDYWIAFHSIHGLTIHGTGQIDGQGSTWWDCRENGVKKCSVSPNALMVDDCNNFRIRGITFLNSQGMHMVLNNLIGAEVYKISMIAPGESPNTDGIHIGSAKNIEIFDSKIGTGDDCVSIGAGTSNVTISNVICGPGHGISVGSLGKDFDRTEAVEHIHVKNCSFTDTMNGVRIKTWQGGCGYARDITFEDITITSVDNPLIIDQYYCNGKHGCANETSAVKLSDISFVNVSGTSNRRTAINLACSKAVPCTNINLDKVSLAVVSKGDKQQAVSYCLNAMGRFSDVSPPVSCLSQESEI